MKTRQPAKRNLSRKARKAISIAQKARWAKLRQDKISNKNLNFVAQEVLDVSRKAKIMSSLIERVKFLDSLMDAYVNGYVDGYNDKRR